MAQKFKSTVRPFNEDNRNESPSSVFSVKSGAGRTDTPGIASCSGGLHAMQTARSSKQAANLKMPVAD